MKVSLITAVRNNPLVASAIESVLSQTHEDLEHIIVDGASTDGTLEIVQQQAGPRTVLISEPDAGIYDALNKGLDLATGEIVGFLHADDLLAAPDTISKIVDAFHDSQADAVYGDLVYVRPDDVHRIVRYWSAGVFSRKNVRLGWMPPHPTLYLRRSLYMKYGAFDTSFRIAADYDLILRLLLSTQTNPAYLPEVLVKMRTGGVSNRSLSTIIEKSCEDYRVLRRHGAPAGVALLRKNLMKIHQFFTRPP